MNTGELIYAWEQFKEAATDAEELFNENGQSYVVYIPTLKQFSATTKPHEADPMSGEPADKIILTFADPLVNVYAIQKIFTHDLITAFDVWHEYNKE